MLPKRQKTRGSVLPRLILTALFLGAAAWLWLNQQLVVDQLAVWQYQPSSQVAAMADGASMNGNGKFLFYASHPVIDGTQNFNKVCNRLEEGTAILGCYAGSQIYIYDVKDERLAGIREVTAAHEMLHAAYQRMSREERERIDALLEIEFKKLENNEEYKERMAFYARTEPGERGNELHSVIGTEVRVLSSELEAHYKQYFIDRSKVVAQYEKYQAVFQELNSQADALYAELKELSSAINSQSAAYNQNVIALNGSIREFNSRASSGAFSSQAQFSSERAVLVARANTLSGDREQINTLISDYEAKRKKYNEIANESKQLTDSINSTLAPAPSV